MQAHRGTAALPRKGVPALTSLLLLICFLNADARLRGQGWSDAFDRPGLVGRVFALGTHAGDLIAGGQTFYADGATMPGVARWDGTHWTGFGSGTSGLVRAVASYNGELIVGGAFTTIGGISAPGIARWTGSAWAPLGQGQPNAPSGPTIYSLAVYNGDLYAGGWFNLVGGGAAGQIARWDGSQWHSVGGGITGSWEPKVLALKVDPAANVLYAGGEFDAAGGVPTGCVARWDGASWSSLGSGITGPLLTGVHALEVFQGQLYAGGNFNLAGGAPARRIASWNGSSWSPVGQGIPDWSIGVQVDGLQAVQGALYVGGNFIEVDALTMGSGIASRAVARWDGQQWSGIGGVSGSDLTTTAIALTEWNGSLIVGGEFTRAGTNLGVGQAVVSTCVVAFDGTTWNQLNEGLGFRSDGLVILPYAGGIAAGGRFVEAGGAFTSQLAWFDGQKWNHIGTVSNGNVWDAIVYNGDLVITGDFSAVDGISAGGTARFDGLQWHAMSGAGGSCLAVYQGQLYAGGIGQPKVWTGSGWAQVGPAVVFGQVNDMLEYAGKLYIGGFINQFSWSTGPGPNIAAWDGVNWSSVGSGVNDGVESLGVYNGELVVGGWFTQAGGAPANRIARWNGSSWSSFATPGPAAGAVYHLASFQGNLLLGGSFTTYQGFPANGLASWNGSSFAPMTSDLTGEVQGIYPDDIAGQLWIVGNFHSIEGVPSWYIARYDATAPMTLDITQPAGPGTGVFVQNSGLTPGRETFNVFSLEPCPGAAGNGPWLGLCSSNPQVLLAQALLPVGTLPFHFIATASTTSFGPFALPPALTLEGISLDLASGLGSVSPVVRYTVQ